MKRQFSLPLNKSRFSDLERLSFALQAAQVGTWDLDLERRQVWWDERCRELHGFVKEVEVAYETSLEYVHPADQSRVDQAVTWALNPKSLGDYDIEFRTIGGEDYKLRWVHSKGQAFFDEHGKAYRFSGIMQDITSLVLARQQLEASERHWRSMIESSPAPTAVLIGREMNVQAANKAMLDIIGRDESILGKDLLEAIPEFESQPMIGLALNVLEQGQIYHDPEGRIAILKEGCLQEYWFSYTYTPLVNEKKKIYGVMVTAIDVTILVQARRTSQGK